MFSKEARSFENRFHFSKEQPSHGMSIYRFQPFVMICSTISYSQCIRISLCPLTFAPKSPSYAVVAKTSRSRQKNVNQRICPADRSIQPHVIKLKIQLYLIEHSEAKISVKRLAGLVNEKFLELREVYLKKFRVEWFILCRNDDFTNAVCKIAEDDWERVLKLLADMTIKMELHAD